MPQKKRYATFSPKKQKIRQVLSSFLVYAIVLFALVGSVLVADVFSGLLTIKTISGLSVKATTKDNTVWAVCTLSTADYQDAVDNAEVVKQRLGAGYVFIKDGVNNVLTSAYANEKDAENVKTKLVNAGEDAQLFKIKLPGITLNLNFTDNALKVLSNSLGLFFHTFNDLQSLSLKMDNMDLTFNQVKTELKMLVDNVEAQIKKFNVQFNSTTSPQLVYVKVFLNKLKNNCSQLLNLENENELSAEIKHAYIDCLKLYIDLEKEL